MTVRISLLLAIAILLGLSHCSRDAIVESGDVDEIEELSNNLKETLSQKFHGFDGKRLAIKEDPKQTYFSSVGDIQWKKGNVYSLSSFRSFEVPYLTTNNNINLYSIQKRLIDDTDQDKILRASYSYSNIVHFKKDANNASEKTIIVTYIPEAGAVRDLKYFKTGERMTLDNIDKFFTGYIEYKSVDNEVFALEYFAGGNMIQRYALSTVNRQKNMLRGNALSQSAVPTTASITQNCQTICTPIYGLVCVSIPESLDGEHCSLKVIGQNCEQVCVDVDPPDHPSPGGVNPNPEPIISAAQLNIYMDQIFEKCTDMQAGSENYDKLISEVQGLLSHPGYACFTEKMLNFLGSRSSEGKIKLCLDESINGAVYDAQNKSFKFKNNFLIRGQFFIHELIHACQDKIYPNGITQYKMHHGKLEIEFETQLFLDLMGRIASEVPFASSSNDYISFLNGLTTDNTGNRNLFDARNYFSSPTVRSNPEYLKYKEEFRQYKPQYNPNPENYINYKIEPLLIKYFLENSNCYQ